MFQGPPLGSISDGGYSACLAEFFPHICGSIRLWVPGARVRRFGSPRLSRPQHSSWLGAETTYYSLKEGEGGGGSPEGVPSCPSRHREHRCPGPRRSALSWRPSSRSVWRPPRGPERSTAGPGGSPAPEGTWDPRVACFFSRTLSQKQPNLWTPEQPRTLPPSIPTLPPAPWSDRLPTGRSPSPSQSISPAGMSADKNLCKAHPVLASAS